MSKICVLRGCKAILNIHERFFPFSTAEAGQILDSLAGPNDLLWPRDRWPAMVLDRGLSVGSTGGHSRIRYSVSEYCPGRRVEFTFVPMVHMQAFAGRHFFEVLPCGNGSLLRHTIDVRTNLRTWVFWKLFIEVIHDAVIEDAFDKVERHAGLAEHVHSRWSARVRFLRWRRQRQSKATGLPPATTPGT